VKRLFVLEIPEALGGERDKVHASVLAQLRRCYRNPELIVLDGGWRLHEEVPDDDDEDDDDDRPLRRIRLETPTDASGQDAPPPDDPGAGRAAGERLQRAELGR
jgi:hypothetical protein